MIIYKVLFLIFLFTRSERAEKFYDPCSKFGVWSSPLVKCPSEKPYDVYLECYDLRMKELYEGFDPLMYLYWCWSRQDINDGDLKNLTISAVSYDNSEINDILNRPFSATFSVNETHIICHDNEDWWTAISDNPYGDSVYCPISTGIPVATFSYNKQRKL